MMAAVQADMGGGKHAGHRVRQDHLRGVWPPVVQMARRLQARSKAMLSRIDLKADDEAEQRR